MKTTFYPRKSIAITLFLLAAASPVLLAAREGSKAVDSGTFGIFISGNRVGTETFTIEDTARGSVTRSTIKVTDGQTMEQTAEMQLASSGDLVKYEWREVSPGKGSRVVQVDPRSPDKFLIEHIDFGDKSKPIEQPFLSPASTIILDDYFFSHRQLLIWRYIGASCKGGNQGCQFQKVPFGALSPHDASSFMVNVEYKGTEKVTIRGTQQDLMRINLTSTVDEWSLWIDKDYKIVKIAITGTNTEIVRD